LRWTKIHPIRRSHACGTHWPLWPPTAADKERQS
jgi:hypothetical protein